jgi:hypothetical protein
MMATLNFLLYTRAYYKQRFPLSLGLLLLPDSCFSSLLAILFVSRYVSHIFPPVSSSACISVSLHTIASPLAYIYTFFGSLSYPSCLSSSLSLSLSLSSMDLTRISYPPFHFPLPSRLSPPMYFFVFPPSYAFFVCLSSVKNTRRVYVALLSHFISYRENLHRLPPALRSNTLCLISQLST